MSFLIEHADNILMGMYGAGAVGVWRGLRAYDRKCPPVNTVRSFAVTHAFNIIATVFWPVVLIGAATYEWAKSEERL
jgi:hypothetical protein